MCEFLPPQGGPILSPFGCLDEAKHRACDTIYEVMTYEILIKKVVMSSLIAFQDCWRFLSIWATVILTLYVGELRRD